MPRVTQHLNHPGHGQPSIDTRYTYSADGHNFLGGNVALEWKDDGLDNLFRKALDYDYGTTETLWVDGKPVRSIVRSFNKFHLITTEAICHGSQLGNDDKEVIGDNIRQVTTAYNLLADRTFAEQPNYCQLPHGVETQWWLKSNATRNRKETVSSTYDDHGNLKSRTLANGIEETYSWYDKAEADYPGDEQGFVRHLKEKTEKPANGHSGSALARTTRYSYQRLPVLAASAAQTQQDFWLALNSETLASGRDLKTVSHRYLQAADETVQPDKPLVHGRLQAQVTAFPNPEADKRGAPKTLDTRIEHAYTFEALDWQETAQADHARDRSYMLKLRGLRVLQDKQTLTGFDGAAKETRVQHSLATGEMVLSRDDTDVEILTLFDPLRRVTHEIVSPGKPEEAERRYEYQLCASESDQATQARIDVKNVKTVAYFDGAYRTVEEQRDDADKEWSEGGFRSTYKATYDAWGNVASETEIDWLKDHELHLVSHVRYDAWGEQLCVIGPDGVGEFAEIDPIGDGSTGPITREWRQQVLDDKGQELENGTKTGVTESQLNLFDNPVRARRLIKRAPADEQETEIKSQTITDYDGFGRRVKEVSGLVEDSQQQEAFTYDPFDRLLNHQLREGEVVVRTYAAHSEKDLPVTIKVGDALLGEQGFDGLDRMVLSKTGGREQTYGYLTGQLKPCTVKTPKGEIQYTYQPHLSEEPVRRILGGQEAAYTLDSKSARLESCSEEGGQAFSRTYFSTGEVKTETRGEYDMAYAYSFRGRLESYVDVLNQTQSYVYDNSGRLAKTSLGALVSEFEYDALSRTLSFKTVEIDDNASPVNSLKTTLGYDELEREISRTFTFGDSPEQVLTQEYDDFDRMTKRTLKEGNTTLREETYKYDTRGRLTTYGCEGDQCPVDPYGKHITGQVFRFDALDNITQVLTRFPGGTNMAVYHFENPDPVQLSRITNNGGAPYPAEIKLEYDANGNLTRDDAGRALEYDALNRLRTVTDPVQGDCTYGYDPVNILSSTQSVA
ncbi:RHS repeat protein [Pseudomonas capeferrum]|nr:RHS repeat protein [Pseudomonas capeferrum]